MNFPQEEKHSNELKELLSLVASDCTNEQLGVYHLLHVLLESQNDDHIKFYKSLKFDIRKMKRDCQTIFRSKAPIAKNKKPTLAPEINTIFKEANKIRRKFKKSEFLPIHVFLAIIKLNEEELKLKEEYGITYKAAFDTYLQRVPTVGGLSLSQNGSVDNLSKYCTNVTMLALENKLELLVGRDKELREIYEVLGRKNKRNIILRGEPGVGKSTIVNGLAQAIIRKEVPDFLNQSNLLTLDIGALLAGASYRGELEERIKNIIAELQNIKNPLLFVDEIHLLVDKEGALGGGFANILKPELVSGRLTIIGATTNDEFRKVIEKDKAFKRRFAIIDVIEPNEEEAIEIIKGVLPVYEKFHGLQSEDNLAKNIVQLSSRYLKEHKLPDSAIDLVDRTFSSVKTIINTTPKTLSHISQLLLQLKNKKDNEKLKSIQSTLQNKINPLIFQQLKTSEILKKNKLALDKLLLLQIKELDTIVKERPPKVCVDDVAGMISVITKIPVGKVQSSDKQRLASIETELEKRVVGQNHALKLVADSIRQFRTGLEEPGKPASFFLLGPTGTGKTELAKTLSTFLFDNQDGLIRFDMSEYRSEQSGELLLGSPPGYVGYNEGGILVNKIREKPFSVVLFDEIEKAHNSIYKIFLQLLDEGKITDRQDRIGDFSNAIILFTSNLGAEEIARFVSDEKRLPSSKELEDLMLNEEYWHKRGIKQPYSKEFLARISALVPFAPNTLETSLMILQIQLNKLIKQLLDKNIELSISEKAITQLLKEGFNPVLGARPLKNTIRQRIRTPIANLIVSSDKERFKINIDYKGKKWIIK